MSSIHGMATDAPPTRDAEVRNRLRRQAYNLLGRSRAGDDASWYIDAFLITLILGNVIAVIIESIDPVGQVYGKAFQRFEMFSIVVFTIEYLCRLWVAVEAPDADPTLSPLRIRFAYAITPMAIVDLLVVLPVLLISIGLMGGSDMRVFRLLRLLRLFKLTRYLDSVALLGGVLRENAANFATALGILLILMILTASGVYLIERDVQPEAFGNIPAAMWWAFATLTTVGYGDVTPITPLGKLFGAAITVVSIGIVALPAGLLASSFSARLRQNSEAYRGAADDALMDGKVTEDELRELEQKRQRLGLGEDLAAGILAEEVIRRGRSVCSSCGQSIAPSPDS